MAEHKSKTMMDTLRVAAGALSQRLQILENAKKYVTEPKKNLLFWGQGPKAAGMPSVNKSGIVKDTPATRLQPFIKPTMSNMETAPEKFYTPSKDQSYKKWQDRLK
jgi:hypothetical protein